MYVGVIIWAAASDLRRRPVWSRAIDRRRRRLRRRRRASVAFIVPAGFARNACHFCSLASVRGQRRTRFLQGKTAAAVTVLHRSWTKAVAAITTVSSQYASRVIAMSPVVAVAVGCLFVLSSSYVRPSHALQVSVIYLHIGRDHR